MLPRVAPHSRSSLWVGSSTANNQLLHNISGEVLYVVVSCFWWRDEAGLNNGDVIAAVIELK